MNIQNTFVLLGGIALCLPGCGVSESNQDRLVRQFNEKVEEIGTIFQTIKDEDTARAAAKKMENLASELSQIKIELDKLPEASDEEYQRVFDEMKASALKTREHTLKLTERIKEKPELLPILAPAMKKLQAAFKARSSSQ